jgi:acetyl-CoA C-acetyltransferase
MHPTSLDPERTPVVVASGQSIERSEWVTPIDLMERACEQAFAAAPSLRDRVDRLSVVNVMTRSGTSLGSELATRIGVAPSVCEVSTIGGNTPQWLVNRAAADIAAGRLELTVIAGAEALRSSRARRAAGAAPAGVGAELPPDPVVGDDHPGIGPAEGAIGLLLPVHVYPMLESVVAARAGHDAPQHRQALGELMAPFTDVAAAHPYAWFPEARNAEQIAIPSPENRVVCEPYTKRMCAYLGSDQGAALIVCSLAAAQRAGVAERAVFVWSGADTHDVRYPTSRSDLGRSPGIAAAGQAAFAAISAGSGGSGGSRGSAGMAGIGIDDIEVLDLYSCFPVAVELAAAALGIAPDDSRALTVTGGLPYFGGPGNNYTTHAIATATDILRDRGAAGRKTGGAGPTLGFTTGLGWFVTKHSVGIYGSEPPPGGYRWADTSAAQADIDASEVAVALEVSERTSATVVAATAVRDGEGNPTGAPVIARLPDGRQMALAAADPEVIAAVGATDVPGLVGSSIWVEPGEARYRLPSG